MVLAEINRDAILLAIKEYNRLGQEKFLKEYGYKESRKFILEWAGNSYDSKAIVGVAHKYIDPDKKPLKWSDFSGGDKRIANFLRRQGFNVIDKSKKPDIEKRAARLTWNTNGWIYPSGSQGKSKSKSAHEGRYGYGHEEWLFDISKLIDGYHYGFLEPIRKHQATFENHNFQVWLYTIDGNTKTRYSVGEINEIEVIDSSMAHKIEQVYQKNGWLREMIDQLSISGANEKGFSNWHGVDLFNIRFRPESLLVNDPYLELSKQHPVYKQSRYAFVFSKGFENDLEKFSSRHDKFGFVRNNAPSDSDNDIPETGKYTSNAKNVEIIYLHKAISKKLVRLLQQKFGKNNVTAEHPAYYGAGRIDIVVQDKDKKLIFYEIKTYSSISANIREALGQLFEYAYWPNNNHAKELIIVSPKLSNEIQASVYMKYLRKSLNVPLYYQSYDTATGVLSEKY